MAKVTKTITLTEQQDNWIKTQMRLGNHSDENEYIQELFQEFLMRSQETEEEVLWLRQELLKGVQSGRSNRTPEEIKNNVRW